MSGTQRFRLAVMTIGVLGLSPAILAGPATYLPLDYPGAVSTFAFGINPEGDIVGSYIDTGGDEHGFVLRGGAFVTIDYPGATWTEAWGINPQGDIVGQYGLPDNTVHGFLRRDDTLYALDVPGQPNTMPVKISPNGTIVGCYHVSLPSGATILDTMFGFVLTPDGTTSYPLSRTMHNGVNSEGDITGNYSDPVIGTFRDSYIIKNGETTWFTFPGSSITRAWDISTTGDVVGWYKLGPAFHGFLLRGGVLTSIDVNLPGVTQTRAFGINPAGDIVGYFQDASGVHAFLLSRRGGE